MEFEFTLTKEFLLNFHIKYYPKTKTFLDFNIALILIAIIFNTFAYIIVDTKYKLMVVIIFFVYVLLLLIFKNGLSKFCILSFFNNYKNKFLLVPTIIIMGDKGISINTKFNQKVIQWTSIKDLHMIENNIIIRLLWDKNYIFIPCECFENKEKSKMIIELFKRNASISPQYNYPRDIKF